MAVILCSCASTDGSKVDGTGAGASGTGGNAGSSVVSTGDGGSGGNAATGTAGQGVGGTTLIEAGAGSGGDVAHPDAGADGASASGATYFIGADISRVQTDAPGTTYIDNDGKQKEMLALLKGHGFNYIRVRTFVDPKAADGNSKTTGFYDVPHTVVFGKRIKDAQMGFLLDFHYSDNWADPGKQCVPVAWQGLATVGQLATAVHDYTKDAISALVAGGARPDMVQIGNEITPGMLLHRCDSGGLPTGPNPVQGSVSTWSNLGTLLKAAAQGVKDVDTNIKIMLHIDKAQDFPTSRSFISNAIAQGVPFDVFGESSYTLYQGTPTQWRSTFTQLAAAFPTLKFVSAEYGAEERAINDVLFNLPNQQGIGTFYWEATHSGADNAGHLLFDNRMAQPDLLLYDDMKTAYAARL